MRDVQLSMWPDVVPERPQGWIMPSVFTGNNADLIAAVAPMYLTGSVLDVTYGAGRWWDRYRPDPFTAHDLHTLDGVNFTALPEPDASIDTVCFDPPYIPQGGTGDARQADYRARFGLVTRHPDDLWQLIGVGLSECARVLAPSGFLLVKCMDYCNGSRLTFGHVRIMELAGRLNLDTHDLIVHHTGSGPGGHNIFTPKRARRHHSYLLVFTPAGAAPVTSTPPGPV